MAECGCRGGGRAGHIQIGVWSPTGSGGDLAPRVGEGGRPKGRGGGDSKLRAGGNGGGVGHPL